MDGFIIVGPTAAGKSSLALEIAQRLEAEIISIDSRQIYRGLDIGTAKPTSTERLLVRHHCLDLLDITEKSNAEWFAREARKAMAETREAGKVPLLVGGSGLYLRAVIYGLFDIDLDESKRKQFERDIGDATSSELHGRLEKVDPESARRIHKNDRYRIIRALEVFELTGQPLSEHFRRQEESIVRPETGFKKIGLDMDRDRLRKRVLSRTRSMYDAGWPEEVSALLSNGADPACPGLRTLGYPETVGFVRGEMDQATAVERIATLTNQYAKRQMTWFRKETGVTWLRADGEGLVSKALNILDTDAPD